jgi:hypothetical protein
MLPSCTRFCVLVGVATFSGCATNSGVVPIGQDTYLVSRQAATGFSGTGSLKAKALREANKYCADQRKFLQVVSTIESTPPYLLGNFPRAEVQFMCLSQGDPELQRPKLTSVPGDASEGSMRPTATGANGTSQALQALGKALEQAPLAPYRRKCTNFGFQDGTPEFAQCVQREYNLAQPQAPILCNANPMGINCFQ